MKTRPTTPPPPHAPPQPAGNQQPAPEADAIDEASEESFPASDPPTFTGTTASPSCPAGDGPRAPADESESG